MVAAVVMGVRVDEVVKMGLVGTGGLGRALTLAVSIASAGDARKSRDRGYPHMVLKA